MIVISIVFTTFIMLMITQTLFQEKQLINKTIKKTQLYKENYYLFFNPRLIRFRNTGNDSKAKKRDDNDSQIHCCSSNKKSRAALNRSSADEMPQRTSRSRVLKHLPDTLKTTSNSLSPTSPLGFSNQNDAAWGPPRLTIQTLSLKPMVAETYSP